WALATTALAVLPAYKLYADGTGGGWVVAGWNVCAVLGAPAVAYALQNYDRRVSRSIAPALAVTVLVSALMVVLGVARHGWGVLSASAVVSAVEWTLLYFPVCFILEEVTFRGALDAYLYRPEDTKGAWTAA